MQLSTLTGPADTEQMALCRDLARMAKTERTFVVLGDSERQGALVVDSFTEAVETIREEPTRPLSVMFDWKFGGSGGSDAVKFVMPDPDATEQVVKQTIDDMITHKIAAAMYEDCVGYVEYIGPVYIVSDN